MEKKSNTYDELIDNLNRTDIKAEFKYEWVINRNPQNNSHGDGPEGNDCCDCGTCDCCDCGYWDCGHTEC